MPEGGAVTNKNQAREFMRKFLVPAADLIAGTDFESSRYPRVKREQTISYGDEPGEWSEIGFSADKLFIDDVKYEILYSVWIYDATTTEDIPFTEDAQKKSIEHRAKIKEMAGDDPSSDDEDDEDFEQEIVEQYEYHINGGTLDITNDLSWVFAEDGDLLDMVDRSVDLGQGKLSSDQVEDKFLKRLDKSFGKEFDVRDVSTILVVLGRLGLLSQVSASSQLYDWKQDS
jgi:hypothetical protein